MVDGFFRACSDVANLLLDSAFLLSLPTLLLLLCAFTLLYGDCLPLVRVWKHGIHLLRVAYTFRIVHRRRQNLRFATANSSAGAGSCSAGAADIAFVDFTPQRLSPTPRRRPLRVVSWNIEFGYALDAVAAELERLDADVICLQEVDRFDDRRRGGAQKDVFTILARRLQLRGVWAGHHSYRCGAWGCAVLSRYALHDARFVPLEAIRGYPRGALSVVIATPLGEVVVHSLHTEVCCGIGTRIEQFEAAVRPTGDAARDALPLIVAGDFNTIGGQLASRLFPMHCTDGWRWRLCAFPCLRMSEAELWQRLLFHSGCRYSHLSDPFDKRSDTTLRAFSTAPLSLLNSAFDAKLDWMLLSAELAAQSHRVVRSAAVDAASDHRPLLCEVVLTHC